MTRVSDSTFSILCAGLATACLAGCGGEASSVFAGADGRGDASGVALGDGGGAANVVAIASPPSYMGTTNDAAGCSTMYRTVGFEPASDAPARHPLFLYFAGTMFVAGDTSTSVDSKAATAVTNAMARRGFVALSAEYDNGAIAWLSDHENQLACLFDSSNEKNLLAAACALPNVDCSLGIAAWGHSQGALVAHLAATHDSRVRAVWTTGYGGDSRATLSVNRLRVVNAEGDTGNALVPGLDKTAGFTLDECPDDGRKQCLRTDGSGWIIVQKVDCAVTSADHCWFDKVTCADNGETLEPNWTDPASTKPFALETNADWVAATLARP